jgi:hypothetical protein
MIEIVTSRIRPWHLATALALATALTIAAMEWWSLSHRYDAGHLLERLPLENSVKLWIDVDQLRASGLLDLLAGSAAAEDPEYRSFTQQIGFDYRTSLYGVAAAFRKGDVYFAVHGKFDFQKLDDYARKQEGGSCRDSVCSLPASQPGRFVSFYPIGSEALALAVSGEPAGVRMIALNAGTPALNPRAPLWISAPGAAFSGLGHLPSGAQAFLSPLAETQESAFSVGPTGAGNALELRLDATCLSTDAALRVAAQLSSTTEELRKMIRLQHLTPSAADLSGLLVSGKFEARDARATGIWPLERKLLESLLGAK